jgi:hypothetical protein
LEERVEFARYLHDHHFWERRLHLDVLLELLAFALTPRSSPQATTLVHA